VPMPATWSLVAETAVPEFNGLFYLRLYRRPPALDSSPPTNSDGQLAAEVIEPARPHEDATILGNE